MKISGPAKYASHPGVIVFGTSLGLLVACPDIKPCARLLLEQSCIWKVQLSKEGSVQDMFRPSYVVQGSSWEE